MAVAAVQGHLHTSASYDQIEIGPYLSRLCESLAASMIGDSRPITLQVLVNGGTALSAKAVSLGLIVTELVINALKHAFPKDRPDGRIIVSYEIDGSDWKLAVSDNGIGKPDVISPPAKGGLGTTLVKALAQGPRCKGRNRQQSGRRERIAHAHGQRKPRCYPKLPDSTHLLARRRAADYEQITLPHFLIFSTLASNSS